MMEDNQEKMSTGYKGNYLFSSMLDLGFYSFTTIFQAIFNEVASSSMLDSGFQAIFDAIASSYLVFFNVGFRFL